MYLIDTDWVIDYLQGRCVAVRLLDELVSDGIAISIVTYAEIYQGIYFGRDPRQAEQGFRLWLQLVTRNLRDFQRIPGLKLYQ
jgi:tRNA(fMet)-specific endonuclease VapC